MKTFPDMNGKIRELGERFQDLHFSGDCLRRNRRCWHQNLKREPPRPRSRVIRRLPRVSHCKSGRACLQESSPAEKKLRLQQAVAAATLLPPSEIAALKRLEPLTDIQYESEPCKCLAPWRHGRDALRSIRVSRTPGHKNNLGGHTQMVADGGDTEGGQLRPLLMQRRTKTATNLGQHRHHKKYTT
ncbi:unnamed protein product [Prorocentrum cordatum]|uniref:Uncharacterized protein n=1 Tax=Prorocentrum cordatum TaxID=2364126 RepID=A0ABN9QBB2_9DINO|nr:unnamed protein product [Polarella glacialis]